MTIRTSGVRTSVDPAALAGGRAGSRPSVLGDTGCRSGYLANQDWLRRTHAYGDLAIALLTLQALMAQRNNWAGALRLVWLFNTVGTVDLINAVRHRTWHRTWVAWYIPTAFVPLVLVTHIMILVRLLRRRR